MKLKQLIAIMSASTFIACASSSSPPSFDEIESMLDEQAIEDSIICPPESYQIRHDGDGFIWRYNSRVRSNFSWNTYNKASESAWDHNNYIMTYGNIYLKRSNPVPCMTEFNPPNKEL